MVIATRGSALALAQANTVLAQCTRAFPQWEFRIRIIKTTGDKLQTASLANHQTDSVKGLFTKELEVALLNREADLAVHSLKDLPTDLPPGLRLGAVCPRADVRDVLIYRDAAFLGDSLETADQAALNPPAIRRVKRGFSRDLTIGDLPPGAIVATSSTRRQAQLLALRPDLKVAPIRGNVGTRLHKLHNQPDADALILAKAGLERLGFQIGPEGHLGVRGEAASHVERPTSNAQPAPTEGLAGPPRSAHRTPRVEGLLATVLEPEEMLPCVGQGAIAIEIREPAERSGPVCAHLNHYETYQCVLAERAFLRSMGGGCQSPVAAYGEVVGDQIRLRAVSYRDGPARRTEVWGAIEEAVALGQQAAARLL